MDLAKIIIAFEESIIRLKEEKLVVSEASLHIDHDRINIKIEVDNLPR
jgi:hypothetical protein